MPSFPLVLPIFDELKPDLVLQESCKQLCQEFTDLFKPELGCVKDFQLERTAKGPKVNDVMRMPAPGNVSGVRSFLGSVLFYSKFLPNLAMLTEPLHRLTKKDTPWRSKLPSKRSRIYFVKTTFLSTSIHLSRLGSLVMPGQQRSLERY
eukprot:Em0023g833a